MDDEKKNDLDLEPEGAEEKKDRPKRRRRRWPIVLLVIFIVLVLMGYGFYEYSNTSMFCGSCHIMRPYYEAWETSTHKDVQCVECHISPQEGAKWGAKVQGMLQVFKYVTRTYSSKPYAEIEDSSCLRSGCHSQRLVEKHSTEKFRNNVLFDHGPHLSGARRGKRLRCTSCHAQMVVGTHMEVTTSTCYLCHFKESDKQDVRRLGECRLCHKALPDRTITHKVTDPLHPGVVLEEVKFNHVEFIGDRATNCRSCHYYAVRGRGEAGPDRCLICHNKPEYLGRIGDLEFLHDNHVTEHNVTCERCHDPIKHEAVTGVIELERTCERCHTSTHFGQREIYMGIGSRGVEKPMPSLKYKRMVDCSACHVETKQESLEAASMSGSTKVASAEACADCHGDEAEDYWGALEDHIRGVKSKLSTVKAALPRARGVAAASSGERKARLGALLEDAEFNINFVELSRGWAHNWDYAAKLLEVARTNLEEITGGAGN